MDVKIQPNARTICQIRDMLCVSASEMQRLWYPACNRKGSTRCGGFGIEDGGKEGSQVTLQGVRVKYTSFCRRELSFQIFRDFQHILWRKRRYGAGWEGSSVGSAVLGGVVGWLVL